MNKKQTTGILGTIIPVLFTIGFYLFIFEYNPNRFNLTESEFIVGFLLEGMPGYVLAKYFNYILIGLIIISFSISLIKTTSNKGFNKFGKLLLLLSGAIYFSFGFTNIGDDSDFIVFLYLGRILLTLLFGAIGFIMISDEYLEISNNKIIKWTIFSFGLLIILNGIYGFFALENYPTYMGLISWVIYFLGFGLIGVSLLNRQRTTTVNRQ